MADILAVLIERRGTKVIAAVQLCALTPDEADGIAQQLQSHAQEARRAASIVTPRTQRHG